MTGIIYLITNTANDLKYVGKTISTLEQRLKEHLKSSNYASTEKRPLHAAMRKYGKENFVIIEVERSESDKLGEREIYWVNFYDTYKNGYNATLGGEGSVIYNYKTICDLYFIHESISVVSKLSGACEPTVRKILKLNNIKLTSKGVNTRKKLSKQICMFGIKDNFVKFFPSMMDAARWLKENKYTNDSREVRIVGKISAVCNGKQLRKSAYGFRWKFLEVKS